MHGLWLIVFAVTAGFTASGIAASLYRLSGMSSQTQIGKIVAATVLIVAGPSVIFQAAMKGLINKEWKPILCWVVIALLAYWSLAIGLFIMDVAFSF